MTELALASLASPLLGDYVQQPRSRRPEQPANASAETRGEPRERATEGDERVISGEIIPASENTYSHLNNSTQRGAQNAQSGFQANSENLNGARRFALQDAIKTYSDNQSIGNNQQRAVQVSGIIDEYV